MTAVAGRSVKGIEMNQSESLKAEIKKLSAKALQAKMDLHDLSEELPQNWQTILAVAQKTQDAFAALEQKRSELSQLEASVSARSEASP